jgi:hypothetical protein
VKTQQKSLFIEPAARAVESDPRLPGEAAADRLLAEARSFIYYWPEDFGGFSALLRVHQTGQPDFCSRLLAPSSRKMEIEEEFTPDPRWLRYQLEELISHRESPKVSKMVNTTGAKLGDCDPIYGQQVYLRGDSMQSYYRIRDRRLTQIGRQYRSQDLLINIDDHHQFGQRFASKCYSAFYRALESGELLKVETYRDDYVRQGEVFLPLRRRVSTASAAGVHTVELAFSEHTLYEAGVTQCQ